jgi:hypothetical protein
MQPDVLTAAQLERLAKLARKYGGSDWTLIGVMVDLIRFLATPSAELRSATARKLHALANWLDRDAEEHARRH